MPPKSILKKTPAVAANAPTTTTTTTTTKAVNPRHLAVARHHASVLEDRKRVEAEVLQAVMTLMDFPSSPDADAKRPTPADARFFQTAIIPFQPADYDALIEERNIADKCGYALCPRPKTKARSTAKKQFVDTEDGVQIVDRKVLEVWCSDDCARRALYVKVQLSEEPAWLRQGGYGDKIELMVENEEEHRVTLPLRPKQPVASTKDQDEDDDVDAAWAAREDAMADLALERGEKPGQVTKANSDLVQDQILERPLNNAPPQPPSLPTQTSDHTMAIEGHVPRINRKDKDDDEDEDDPQDWEKHLPG
ncbi:hypothetical protein COCVIDRAFT_110995 [Bipolaris victoriae FI3]|uniref:RNA polymerase II subunit B1 CTD phosphatase RPAP2 homolog n=1 Tax=Bipolaris victoriae (strain FI3) TaxID=930091 RepID=W7E2Z5_BIPV3|nr:hypothetical protein COCVIDRAFT_110995 [Bipolaris victoriae FI3]